MKKLKAKQLGAWCTYCEPKTSRAVYRPDGWHGSHRACEEHRDLLQEWEDKNSEVDCGKYDYLIWR